MSAPVTEGEETLWTGSVSNWHYAGKWLLVVLFLAALGANIFLRLISDPTTSWIVCGVLALLAIVLIVWIRLDRAARKYTVTNRRVSVEFGIVSKRSNELRIHDIRSINLTTTGLSGLIGIGRVEFSSAATDDADVIFWNTPGAAKVRDLVRSLQTAAGV
ncbi:MAG: PH domain-containing protein [Chthoniobacter sp.]